MKNIKNILILFIILSSYFLICCNNEIVINYVIDSEVNSISLKENKMTINDIPEKSNIKYLGIYYDDKFTNEYKGEKLKNNATLYIKYEPEYLITYIFNNIEYKLIINKNELNVNDLLEIKKNDILGLYLDADYQNEFNGNVYENTILYVKCKESCIVTFVYDNGEKKEVVLNKNKLTYNDIPQIENYEVLGLYLDSDFQNEFDFNLDSDKTIYVKGKYIYNIKLVYENHTDEILINKKIFSLDDIVKDERYEYYGLYLDNEYNNEFNGEINSDITIYIKRKRLFKINLIYDNGNKGLITITNNKLNLYDIPAIKGYEIIDDITLYVETKKWDNTYLLEEVFKHLYGDNTTQYENVNIITFSTILGNTKTIFDKNSQKEILNMFNLEFCDKDYLDYPYDSIPLTYEIILNYGNNKIYLKLHNSGHLSFILYKQVDENIYEVETEFIEFCHVCLTKMNYDKTIEILDELYEKEQ